MHAFKVLARILALIFAIWYLNRRKNEAQGSCVSHFTHSNGIEEEIELHHDGTYCQTITDTKGNAFHNSGTWNRHKGFAEMFGSYSQAPDILLRNWADPLEVVRKQSVSESKKTNTTMPSHSFRPQNQ